MKTLAAICCFLLASCTAGPDLHVSGAAGGDVTFRCDHKAASTNNKYFCRSPCTSVADTLATVTSGTKVQSGRVTLEDWGNGSFTVNIGQLQPSDAGKYWCAVERAILNTFTGVNLDVEEGVTTTTVHPDVFSTWTHLDISNSTQLEPELDTSETTHMSTTSNATNGGEDAWSVGSVLFASIGAFSTFTVLVCAACVFRKCRELSKPQPQVCSSSSADLTEEVDTVYENTGKHVQHVDKPPTPASKPAVCSSSPVYENLCMLRDTSVSRQVKTTQNWASQIYIKPLPPELCETSQNNTPTEICVNGGADARAGREAESQSGALWFGLDVTGTI